MPALTPAAPPRLMSLAWYLVAAGLFVSGVGVAAIGASQWSSTIEGMHRVAMPGTAEVILPIGLTTLYGETESLVDGKSISASGDLSFMCKVSGPSGANVKIATPPSRVSYSSGGYSGRNAIDIHTDTAGPHTVECESSSPFVAAIGRGIGTWRVVGLVGGVVPCIFGVAVFLLVLLKRRKQMRQLAASPAPRAA